MGFGADSDLSFSDEARCRRILWHATEAFLANGFAGTSVEDVAIEASVSKVTIYRFFTDKLGLATAVMNNLSQDLETECRNAIDAEAPPEKCLFDLGVTFHRWMTRRIGKTHNFAFLRLLIEMAGPHPEFSRTWIEASNRAVVKPLTKYLEKCVDEEALFIEDPRFCASQFIGYIYHASQSILWSNAFNDDPDMMARKVQLFLQGCLADQSADDPSRG